jgi:integrase
MEKKLISGKPLSAAYIKLNSDDVKRHIKTFPPFAALRIKDLTSGLIREWMLWAAEKGLSGRRINTVLSSMRVAVRDLANREDLDWDPFKKIKDAAEQAKEKGVLSAVEASKIIRSPAKDDYSRAAVLLGLLCGMRRGEIRGLQWEDVNDKHINVRNNWQDMEGIKRPKNGSVRIAPLPSPLAAVLKEVRKAAPEKNGFVLESPKMPDRPVCNNFFSKALTKELTAIGISAEEQKRRNITFHSLRHTFVTLGRLAGISDAEIQALAGHKDAAMMNRYSHAGQAIDFAAAGEKLERALQAAAL